MLGELVLSNNDGKEMVSMYFDKPGSAAMLQFTSGAVKKYINHVIVFDLAKDLK